MYNVYYIYKDVYAIINYIPKYIEFSLACSIYTIDKDIDISKKSVKSVKSIDKFRKITYLLKIKIM